MNVIATGLDYSAKRLSGAAIKAAGYQFVNRYLWFPGQSHAYLTADEYRDLTTNGIEVHAVYEQTTSDPAGGWNAGVAMARQAVDSARAAGLPMGHTVYMCADAWLSTHGIPVSTAMSFLDGARSVLAPAGYMTGAYGFQDFVYAAQDGNHADRFWLCGAESGVRAGIHHYQWNNGRVYVSGLECDLNKQYIPMFEGSHGGGGVGGDEVSVQDVKDGFAELLADMASGKSPDPAENLRQVLTQYKMPKAENGEETSIHDEVRWLSENFRQVRAAVAEPGAVSMSPEDRAAIVADLKSELAPLFDLARRLES